ncbi:MAG TPA: SusC/RagA family TonB-linked outer membrane protein [Balneolales bacterium]|nr:SusC/RagA family TonB-linked outer membrane protein [Balneolales bacterium]
MKQRYKVLSTVFLLLFVAVFPIMAQQKTISGTVRDANSGMVLPGVNVVIKGTTTGTATNPNGKYTLNVPSNADSLVFSYIGYQSKSLAIKESNVINVSLSPTVESLNNVVVTAFGLKQQTPSLGYEVPQIGSQQVAETKETNVVQALQGQFAGVSVTSTGGNPGQSARIVIRGINSLDPGADNQPLFVVDGVPVNNSTYSGGLSSEDFGFSNLLSEMNPQDIESISVLKSGAATALYGIRAANGAIIITTKKGVAGKTHFSYTSSVQASDLSKVPKLQKTYLAGWYGLPNYKSYDFPFHAWGPKADTVQGAKFYNNFQDFYRTGLNINNDLSVSGGNQRATFYLSANNQNQTGITPNTKLVQTSVRLRGDVALLDNLHITGSANYISNGGRLVPQGHADFETPMADLLYYPTSESIYPYQKADGTQISYTPFLNNPLYEAYHFFMRTNGDRVLSNAAIKYDPLSWLTINYRIGDDVFSDHRNLVLPGPLGVPNELPLSSTGYDQEFAIKSSQFTSTLLVTARKQISQKWQTELTVGNDVFANHYYRLMVKGDNFNIPQFYDISNTSTITTSDNTIRKRVVGVYGDLRVNYNDLAYLTLTGRNDWSSTLPVNNRSFFYPSASGSFILSKAVKLPDVISFAKLRASYAIVGKDAPPYSTGVTYESTPGFPFRGRAGITKNNTLGDPNLKPEKTNSFEFGTDLRFFNDRLSLSATWYKQISRDQIFPVPVSDATGYSVFVTNAGQINNQGLELTVSGFPVQTPDFSWQIKANFTKNDNKVVSIRQGIDNIQLNGASSSYGGAVIEQLIPGMPYGAILGTTYKRYYADPSKENSLTVDKNAPLLIGPDGFPEVDYNYKIVGNATPKWTAGITNNLSYKNFNLSFLVDIKKGGDLFNTPAAYFAAQGTLPITATRDQFKVFKGVHADGTPNTTKVWLGQGVGPDGVNYGDGYFRNVYRKVISNFVQDASWVRLQYVTLSYNLPKSIYKNTPLDRIGISLTANNILLWTPYPGFDPESSQYSAASNTQGFQGRTTPQVRSFTASINFGF